MYMCVCVLCVCVCVCIFLCAGTCMPLYVCVYVSTCVWVYDEHRLTFIYPIFTFCRCHSALPEPVLAQLLSAGLHGTRSFTQTCLRSPWPWQGAWLVLQMTSLSIGCRWRPCRTRQLLRQPAESLPSDGPWELRHVCPDLSCLVLFCLVFWLAGWLLAPWLILMLVSRNCLLAWLDFENVMFMVQVWKVL